MKYRTIPSPVGELLLAGESGNALEIIGFSQGKGAMQPDADWVRCDDIYPEAASQLAEYFAGERRTFSLVLKPSGTPFQLSVLDALQAISYGRTATYRDIAQAIGRPTAVRAVGAANSRNPLPIVIPCHRVIGADGSLTGFGGGLAAKAYLLNLEAS